MLLVWCRLVPDECVLTDVETAAGMKRSFGQEELTVKRWLICQWLFNDNIFRYSTTTKLATMTSTVSLPLSRCRHCCPGVWLLYFLLIVWMCWGQYEGFWRCGGTRIVSKDMSRGKRKGLLCISWMPCQNPADLRGTIPTVPSGAEGAASWLSMCLHLRTYVLYIFLGVNIGTWRESQVREVLGERLGLVSGRIVTC